MKPEAKTPSKEKARQVATPGSDSDNDMLEPSSDVAQKTPKAKTKKRDLTEKELEAKEARQTAPIGQPGALAGYNMMFIGSLSLDHVAYEKATANCGGKVVKKLEDADYIVVGKRPGTKNEEALADCSRTIKEAKFMNMLQGGSPDDLLSSSAEDDAEVEVVAKKQRKK